MILDQVAGYIYHFFFLLLVGSLFFISIIVQTFFNCRYTTTYANKMTFATVKVTLISTYFIDI